MARYGMTVWHDVATTTPDLWIQVLMLARPSVQAMVKSNDWLACKVG